MKQPDEGNLFTDLMEFGPAPTMAREIVVIVISAAMLAIVFAVLGPSLPLLVATAVVGVFMAGRFVLGLRGWSNS